MSLVSYCYASQQSNHIRNMQIPCGVRKNKAISKALKKFKKGYQTSNKL